MACNIASVTHKLAIMGTSTQTNALLEQLVMHSLNIDLITSGWKLNDKDYYILVNELVNTLTSDDYVYGGRTDSHIDCLIHTQLCIAVNKADND